MRRLVPEEGTIKTEQTNQGTIKKPESGRVPSSSIHFLTATNEPRQTEGQRKLLWFYAGGSFQSSSHNFKVKSQEQIIQNLGELTGKLLSFQQWQNHEAFFTSKHTTWYLFDSVFLRFLKVDGGDPKFRGCYPLQSGSKLSVRALRLQVKVDHQQAPLGAGRSHLHSRGAFWTQTKPQFYDAFHGEITGKLCVKIMGMWLTLYVFWLSFKSLLFFY